jgi:hypothetical protein
MKIPVIPHARPLLFIFLLLPSLWSREKNLRSRPPFGIIIGISPFLLQYEFSHLNEPVGLSLHLSLSIGFVFRCFPLSLLLKRVVTPYRHSFKGGWLHTGMVSPSTELSALLFPSK